jgi:hypothetical protein
MCLYFIYHFLLTYMCSISMIFFNTVFFFLICVCFINHFKYIIQFLGFSRLVEVVTVWKMKKKYIYIFFNEQIIDPKFLSSTNL